ncbi:hypothetical protein DFH08DRAFT_833533 [Mycena albidolilacea]|uniref:Membrane anchor Opy2 N-terminal domain-containing protein n=1 Tax=Mycena albidolilacea TaxID=1033008 RepID=A0AAD7AQG3_9AGAR|nr:hypothetical protein DFH08DRAFT_833533 [Mycena albidolilacea]
MMRLLALLVVASILAPAMAQSAAPSTGCIVCPSVPACNCAENQQCVLTPRTCNTCASISCTTNDGPSSGSALAAPSSTGSALRSGVNSGICAGVIVGLAALGLVR